MRTSDRPYVICHMVPSVDGRIVTRGWNLGRALTSEYERTAATFRADAWIIGRVSMEPYAGRARLPALPASGRILLTDFVARTGAPSCSPNGDGDLRRHGGRAQSARSKT